MILLKMMCDTCGATTDNFEYIRQLFIDSEKKGWRHEKADDPAVRGKDYCPQCDPYLDLGYHGPYGTEEPEWTI